MEIHKEPKKEKKLKIVSIDDHLFRGNWSQGKIQKVHRTTLKLELVLPVVQRKIFTTSTSLLVSSYVKCFAIFVDGSLSIEKVK